MFRQVLAFALVQTSNLSGNSSHSLNDASVSEALTLDPTYRHRPRVPRFPHPAPPEM